MTKLYGGNLDFFRYKRMFLVKLMLIDILF